MVTLRHALEVMRAYVMSAITIIAGSLGGNYLRKQRSRYGSQRKQESPDDVAILKKDSFTWSTFDQCLRPAHTILAYFVIFLRKQRSMYVSPTSHAQHQTGPTSIRLLSIFRGTVGPGITLT